jgi:uronate dehydrogenase
MKLILLTGAAGGVARMIRPILTERYRLRLSDKGRISDPGTREEVVPADLTDLDTVRAAVRGVDGIIHFGGYSVEADWETISAANITGTYNLFEAARLEGVRRVVFASSNHVMGFYPRSDVVGVEQVVLPDTRYGVSKALGEALGALYAHKYGLEVLAIRIGHIVPKPETIRDLSIWQSPRDACQLIQIGLEYPDIRYEVVFGTSDNARTWWDNSNAYRLGYRPEDRSEPFAPEVLTLDKPNPDPRTALNQGGNFCIAERM